MFGSSTGNLTQQQQPQQQGGGGGLFGTPSQQPLTTIQQPLTLGSTIQQQPLTLGSTIQQQQPQQGGILFGSTSQQQPQQFPQQQLPGGGPFGFASQQQQQGALFSFTQQQPQQQGGLGFSSPFNQPRQQQLASVGTDGPANITWVAASNGHIPEGAVVGGWASSTQEPYYIARAKSTSDGALCPGVVLKSTKVCSFGSNNTGRHHGGMIGQYPKPDTNPNYEILVLSDSEESNKSLFWVFVNFSRPGSFNSYNNKLPMNSLKVGYDSQGSPTFIGRAPSIATGDIVPGTFKGNTLVIVENEQLVYTPFVNGFEVLCAKTDQATSERRVENRYLYDIKYDLGSQTVDWTDGKKLGRSVLLNKSSQRQKMKPTFKIMYSTKLDWNLSDSTCKDEIDIKGDVPYVFGSSEDNYFVDMLDSNLFQSCLVSDSFSMNFGGNGGIHNLHGGHLPNMGGGYLGGGLGGFAAFVGSSAKDKGIFTPTLAVVKDLSKGLHLKKQSICDSTSFNVPPRSKLIVEQQGQEVTLTVSFRATLKTVYSNDCVQDEEVTGTYKHSSITATYPSVIGQETALDVY